MTSVATADWASAPAPLPFVSVIIPVFADEEGLDRCLRALEEQTYPSACFEVVVVDNGGNPRLHTVTSRFRRATVVRETAVGAYAARNRGIALARGEVLAFTDADCIPQPRWLERGVAALGRAPRCGFVAGRIEVFPRDPVRPRASELYESAAAFRQKDYVERWRFGATANLLTRRSVFDRVGSFDGRLRSLGDREWGTRVFEAGYEVVYDDDAVVRHPARATLSELWRRAARTAGGYFDLIQQGHPPRALYRDAWVGLAPLAYLLGRSTGSGGLSARLGQRATVALLGLSIIVVRLAELTRRTLGGAPRRR